MRTWEIPSKEMSHGHSHDSWVHTPKTHSCLLEYTSQMIIYLLVELWLLIKETHAHSLSYYFAQGDRYFVFYYNLEKSHLFYDFTFVRIFCSKYLLEMHKECAHFQTLVKYRLCFHNIKKIWRFGKKNPQTSKVEPEKKRKKEEETWETCLSSRAYTIIRVFTQKLTDMSLTLCSFSLTSWACDDLCLYVLLKMWPSLDK